MPVGSQPQVSVGSLVTLAVFSVSMDGSGTADVCTAAGDVEIRSVTPFVKTAPTGLTSSALVTNESIPKTLLAATLLASLIAGTTLTPYSNQFFLGDTKKIQRTNVGTGTGGGVMLVGVEYFKGTGNVF